MKKITIYFNSIFKKISTKTLIISIVVLLLLLLILFILIFKNNKVILTCDDAEAIALTKVKNGLVTQCNLEHKKYNIEIISKNLEYEFEIDGNTGEIISYESDNID